MNKEDVFYNVKLSIDFYFREVFCKKYGFYETKIKKIQTLLSECMKEYKSSFKDILGGHWNERKKQRRKRWNPGVSVPRNP